MQMFAKLHVEQPANVHTDVQSTHFHVKRRTKQGDPLSTLQFNALLQYNMKLQTDKVEQRSSRSPKLVEDDHDTNLSNLRFADDIHRLTRAHDHHARRPHHIRNGTRLATTHHENKQHFQKHFHQRRKIKHLGQLITLKNAVEVEFDHRIKCACATFTSHRKESSTHRFPSKGRLKTFRCDENIIVFYAS